MEMRAREADERGPDAAPACSAGCRTRASRPTCAAPCSSPRTARSSSTRASTTPSCASRSRSRSSRASEFRGASTITQQLAKNLYLSPSRDPLRKLRELIITRRLEAELSQGAHLRDLPQRGRVGRRHLGRRGGGACATSACPRPRCRASRRRCWPARSSIRSSTALARPPARLLRRQQIILGTDGQRTSRAAPDAGHRCRRQPRRRSADAIA